jgi:outer membrane protein assembly factor BamA
VNRMVLLVCVASFGMAVASGPARGQDGPSGTSTEATDSIRAGQGTWVLLPVAFYTPETGIGGGGVVGRYVRLDRAVETSSLLTAMTVTVRGQRVIETIPELYLGGGTRIAGNLRYQHYPDVFYGVGPDTPETLAEDYTPRVLDLRGSFQRPVRPGFRLGVAARFRNEKLISLEEGGLLDGGTIGGSDGGRAVGLGLIGTWDTRDNRFSPRSGGFVEASWVLYDGALGSDFDFQRVMVDGRKFLALGERSTLGFQGYVESTPGAAPFSLLPLLGGTERMRGYREGRFRDRALVTAQTEVRFPIWWRFGGVAFVGMGDVAPRFSDLDISALELAGGAGLRFRLTREGVTIRGDYAIGEEGGQLYLTIGHSF